jgi:hypothetical protein
MGGQRHNPTVLTRDILRNVGKFLNNIILRIGYIIAKRGPVQEKNTNKKCLKQGTPYNIWTEEQFKVMQDEELRDLHRPIYVSG